MGRPLEPGRDLSPAQVARLCRMAYQTVRRATRDGLLVGYALPGSRRHRYTPAEVIRFMARHAIPVPAALRALTQANPE